MHFHVPKPLEDGASYRGVRVIVLRLLIANLTYAFHPFLPLVAGHRKSAAAWGRSAAVDGALLTNDSYRKIMT
jgi:hypothetical protein